MGSEISLYFFSLSVLYSTSNKAILKIPPKANERILSHRMSRLGPFETVNAWGRVGSDSFSAAAAAASFRDVSIYLLTA